MKIVCLTTMYKRPKVSELFLTGMKRLGIPVVASTSDSESHALCKRWKIDSFSHFNQPLGKKFNATLRHIDKFHDYTHVMISGDDDLYLDSVLPLYEKYQHLDCVGFKGLYFIEPATKNAVQFSYDPRTPKIIGAGRLIRREVIQETIRVNRGLWDPKKTRGLDASMDALFERLGVQCTPIDEGVTHVIDVKTTQNIWRYHMLNLFKYDGNIVTPAEYDDVVAKLPEEEQTLLADPFLTPPLVTPSYSFRLQ